MIGRQSLLAAATVLAAVALPARSEIAAKELVSGVSLVVGEYAPGHQPDGNSVLLTGNTGLVVVDTGRHIKHSDTILAAAAAMKKPVAMIINTHWHLDHVSGNPRVRGASPGLKVYASNAIDDALKGFLADGAKAAEAAIAAGKVPAELIDEVRADIATTVNGNALRPDVVIDKSQRLKLAGRKIELRVARNAATQADLWLLDRQSGTLVAGDLVTLPAPFLDTACPQGWRSALAAISATRFKLLVPGHGAPMTKQDFENWRHAFGRFVDCVRSVTDETTCAQGWAKDLGPLLLAAEQRRANEMTLYYVRELRAEAGRNRNCHLV